VCGRSPIASIDPVIVCDDLATARAAIPCGLCRVERDVHDDVVIVETWI
jgi:hypothetical protein